MNAFYTVIVLLIDTFESSIADERHFGTRTDAESYVRSVSDSKHIAVLVQM